VVRIQDTNTTELGVIMLLLFIPQLRSLGGFIYYRNVGDAILSLLDWNPSLSLRLTDLWDTHLPDTKVDKLIEALPRLQSLYTRGTYLPKISAWQHLSSLTIDFDFRDFAPLLEDFLAVCGARLQKLAIVDQVWKPSLVTPLINSFVRIYNIIKSKFLFTTEKSVYRYLSRKRGNMPTI
jgi:hypothetical protein